MPAAASPIRPIRLVIFDLDEVLVHFRPQRRLDYLSGLTGIAPEILHRAIWGSPFEPDAEAGAYADPDEYLAEFNRRIGYRLSKQQWIMGRRVAMRLRPEVLEVARSLQGQVELALLTNNGSLLKESLPLLVPEICAVFGDRAHASYEFKARKPDVAVYRRLVARYGIPPEQALHIDDNPEFVNGAIAAGVQGIIFRTLPELVDTLSALGLSGDRLK